MIMTPAVTRGPLMPTNENVKKALEYANEVIHDEFCSMVCHPFHNNMQALAALALAASPSPEPRGECPACVVEAAPRDGSHLCGRHRSAVDAEFAACERLLEQSRQSLAVLTAPPVEREGTTGATHRCNVCEARWRDNHDGTWTLISAKAGACCDNQPMRDQIEPLPEVPHGR